MKTIAAVTGATGIVGSEIVSMLLAEGYSVRVLTRNRSHTDARVEIIYGDLGDTTAVHKLVEGVELLFHCAAELVDESKMWAVNAQGTQILIGAANSNSSLRYICHLSSVGVIGLFKGRVANEQSECKPLNIYEKSKFEAEVIVKKYIGNAKVVILRPTNVVSSTKNDLQRISALKVFVKGGENAHLVHASDVASAALYFVQHPPAGSPECYVVSCDDHPLNTIAGCNALCAAIRANLPLNEVKARVHLPWVMPYILRRFLKGPCNRSNVRYASDKLSEAGFRFPLGFLGALQDLCKKFEK